ncbi:MAG: phosphoribosylglycinamide formyltransferase [Deltaproteobacteria bacterium SG8_13]|nr:MAG: phosphoribosylglycinamide formyltransferase [Deltaproteobacteria bacterium SG8_13]
MKSRIRIGALISGTGTNLQAILKACDRGEIDGQVVFIGSDNPEAAGLQMGRQAGIATIVVDYDAIERGFRADPDQMKIPPDFHIDDIRRKQHLFPPDAERHRVVQFLTGRSIAEDQLLRQMQAHPFDLLVCAGFMRVLTPYFIDRVNIDPNRPRIMNIHPALLPAFPGVDGYADTFRYGCKIAGCTVHFIDYGEDTGPIISQRAFAIRDDDTLESVKKKGLALEWEVFPHCIQLFARGRLRLARRSFELAGGVQFERTVVNILPAG